MQKLLERVEVLSGDYCRGAGCNGRRFRHIMARDSDGKPLCADCVRHSLSFGGYAYKPSEEQEERVKQPKRPSEPKMVTKSLMERILFLLEGNVYTKKEIAPLVVDITPAITTLETVLRKMQCDGQLGGVRLSPCKQIAYVLPGCEHLVRDRFGFQVENAKRTARTRILEALKDSVLTNQELLSIVGEATRSQGTLNGFLWRMRRDKEIIGFPMPDRGRMLYVLPGNEHLIQERYSLCCQQQVLAILDQGKVWFMSDLAAHVGRQRTVVNRWVRMFEQEGLVRTVLISIPGVAGNRRMCFKEGVNMQPSTAILVADLEAKRDQTTNPHYERMLELAKIEYFNYLRSPLPSPSETLIKDLIVLGFYDLVEKAQNGGYDAHESEYP